MRSVLPELEGGTYLFLKRRIERDQQAEQVISVATERKGDGKKKKKRYVRFGFLWPEALKLDKRKAASFAARGSRIH
jgi:hypothetical protein